MPSNARNSLPSVVLLAALTACSSDRAATPSTYASGGSGGSGGSGLTLTPPVDRGNGKLALELGSTYFEVTPEHGARISSLRQNGVELLFLAGAANYEDALGSTFWPSPQTWGWPPPSGIDLNAYVASVDGAGIITAQGATDSTTNLKVAKRFSANLGRGAIDIEYSMTNTGAMAAEWAPWEITRVPALGLAFWPTGAAPLANSPFFTQAVQGQTWADPKQTQGEGKLFADGGGGYLAYVLGDRLLVKQFTDQPPSAAAPGEAEIELYVNPDHNYVEVENQGAYQSIAPGETITWKVTWFARQLPAGVTASLGNPDLIAFVVKTLG